MRNRCLALLVLIACTLQLQAQTPIANRVHAAARHLEPGCRVVAKYTDNQRHSLYYASTNRLFCYDVWTDKTREVKFSDNAYETIHEAYLSPKSRYIFIDVERGQDAAHPLDNHRQLWIYDTLTGKYDKVGEGFDIARHKEHIVIKQTTRCLNPKADVRDQRWMVRDHYYYLADGHNIWAKDEYEYRP